MRYSDLLHRFVNIHLLLCHTLRQFQKWHQFGQGGRGRKNIGGVAFSDNDVIISVTSLLLKNLAKILGGLQPTQPIRQRPPWPKVFIQIIKTKLKASLTSPILRNNLF